MIRVFILGHWRSGTRSSIHVHNVFSCDKHFGYNTTYQTVFPHLMMWGSLSSKEHELADAVQTPDIDTVAGSSARRRICLG